MGISVALMRRRTWPSRPLEPLRPVVVTSASDQTVRTWRSWLHQFRRQPEGQWQLSLLTRAI
jgi:hypothetical protein